MYYSAIGSIAILVLLIENMDVLTGCNNRVICDIFSHSPVFRIGGDEFVVISQGADYERIDELIGRIGKHNEEAARDGGVIVACGMSKYDDDDSSVNVFERADHEMYKDKARLKGEK